MSAPSSDASNGRPRGGRAGIRCAARSAGLGLGLAACAWSSQVVACSCMEPGSPSADAARAEAVFVGTVMSVTDPQPPNTWWTRLLWRLGRGDDPTSVSSLRPIRHVFQVQESFKGNVPKKAVVLSPADESSCGYRFRKGERYVVYAHSSSEEGYRAGRCALTGPAADPRSGLQWLRLNRGRL